MASLKPYIKPDHINSDGKANLKIRVSHRGNSKKAQVRYISTAYYIDPKYVKDDGSIKPSYPGQQKLTSALLLLLQEYYDTIASCGTDINHMDVNSLVKKLKAQNTYGSSFTKYMKYRMEQLRSENRFAYADSYEVTLTHLQSFKPGEIEFTEITVGFLNDFKGYLRQVRSSSINTVRIYLNNIRAVFYSAMDNGIVKLNISPFRKFKIEQEKTTKRSLDVKDLQKLLDLRVSVTKQQQRAIDIFFLIFYLVGINLKDLLYLKPGDVHKGRILYRRFKTGREYSIKIYAQAQMILDRYQGKSYLLCFMDEKGKTSPGRMNEADHDVLSQINKLLKTVVKNNKLSFKVSTYSARHSWATIASKIGISRDVISHALGHGTSGMTDIYIDFDLSKVDQANRRVISKLKG